MSDRYSNRLIRSIWDRLLGKSHDGKRDRYEVFGWQKALRSENFVGLYHRNGVASRIIRAFPQATWASHPVICDDSDDDASGFTQAFDDLNKRLRIMHYLERADRLSGIGQFGVLYLGFADNAQLRDPVEGNAPLMYLSAYGEYSIEVQQWDMDPRSPRFNMPTLYTLQTGRTALATETSASRSITVHHTRVLHLAEQLDDDEVYGIPRLLPAYNYLEDLEKVCGSSAETFWLAANRGILWSADSDAEFDEADSQRLKEQAEEYDHQLRRSITATGLSAQVLGSDTPSPEANAKTLLMLIAGTYGMPQRILTGTESGEMASTQDITNWNVQIDNRRQNYAGPRILRPLIERLIETGNLPKPNGQFYSEWDSLTSLSKKDQADINKVKTDTLVAYTNAIGADLLVPPREFRADFLGMSEESEYLEEDEQPLDEGDEDVQAGFGKPPAGGENDSDEDDVQAAS